MRTSPSRSKAASCSPARVCEGIIGQADLRLGHAVDEVLEAHIAAGKGHFRGIRSNAQFDEAVSWTPTPPPKGLLLDQNFAPVFRGWRRTAWSATRCSFRPQLPELADLARAFPDTTIIVNHCGGPLGVGPYAGKRDEMYCALEGGDAGAGEMPQRAREAGRTRQPVFFRVEFSRAKRLRRHRSRSRRRLRPYVEVCIEAFGPNRCMFESNFPADKESCSYAILWNAFKRLAAGYSAAEKQALFSGTAARAYRLET